jgi:hypothetical protein
MNDYFSRAVDPGKIIINPPDLVEQSHLWNGKFEVRFRVPWNAQLGDEIKIKIRVTDIEREARGMPFVSTFTLKAIDDISPSGTTPRKRRRGLVLALPNITEIHKEEWGNYGFDKFSAIKLKNDGRGGYDCFINVDNAFLLTEISKAKEADKPLVKYWFRYGLVIAALGMLRHQMRLADKETSNGKNRQMNADEEDAINPEDINRYCDGLAQVIVPIIRTLNRSPVAVSS